MKKLLLIAALFSMSASVFADGLTATLQQGDVMTPFYGVNAFQEAYNVAQNGAVITLSPGIFNDVSPISKQITIIGSSAFDKISANRTYLGSTRIATHNVKIEGVYFLGNVVLGTSSLTSITNCTIKRCWIETSLIGSYKHENTLVDQCVIKKDQSMAKGYNYCIKNSTIGYFSEQNTATNMAYITNCVVWNFCSFYYGGKDYSSYTNGYSGFVQPFAIYKNNYLGIHKETTGGSSSISLSSPSEYYNNLLCQTYMKQDYQDSEPYSYLRYVTISYGTGCVNENNVKGDQKFNAFFEYPAHPVDAPLGGDSTVVGPYGGTGFSEYPSIPRIISKSIDSNSDDEGKINVRITVKAEQ